MALDAGILTDAMVNALLALPVIGDPNGATYGALLSQDQKDTLSNNIGSQMTELINHIKENAVLTVAMATHTHSGVTTGPGISGPPVPGTVETGDPAAIPPIMPGGIT